MSSYWKRKVTWLLVPLALLPVAGLLGCPTFTSELKATVQNPPSVAQVPLTVGIYYSPEFQAYKHVRTQATSSFVVPLGQPSVRLFDQVFAMMFEKVEPVSSRPPLSAAGPHLAAVIEPRIEEFHFDSPQIACFGPFYAKVTYRFTLYSLEGTPVVSWTVTGVGQRDCGFDYITVSAPIGEASDLALQDAAMKLMTGFRDVPEVRRWLRRVGVLDPK